MSLPIPASLHRALYRLAYRLRRWMRRTFRLPIYGVGAILRDGEGRILLVRHSYGTPGWALPGGGRGRLEDPELAVRRELREELGLEIEALELLATLEEQLSGAPHTASLFAGIAVGEPRPDGREVIAVRFFAAGEMPEGLSAPARLRLEIWHEHVSGQGAGDHNKGS
jgi:ADP-ribose pyrophosphatase YjhB (NUDIX family)